LILTLSQCINRDKDSVVNTDPRGDGYAGAAACNNCHKNIYNSYLHTAHNKSSAPASKETVKGSFEPGANEYFYRPDVKVMMEKRDSGLFQVAYMNNIEKRSNRFDIAIGSGRKAQTYLYWLDSKMYQLPVSWFVPANSWANSPGYPPHQVRFDRNVPIGCFECHSTYVKVASNEVAGTRVIDNFDKNTLLYGIDCERCHGPAAQHVSFHEEHPREKASKYITIYSSLTRQQKVDMCATCHSGIQQMLKSTFLFKPGDTLLNAFFTPSAPVSVSDLDVHGNQTQLLTASACFIKSKTLTCGSCHNTHVTERENIALFSKRCINCHTNMDHHFSRMASGSDANITANCIDCHMPAKPSKIITLLSNGQTSPRPDSIRTHLITVYPEETKKYLSLKK
jgi:hypothetical protein